MDGPLTGAWAEELARIAQQPHRTGGCIVDLQAISSVDSAGEYALRSLDRSGVSFIAESPYGKDLCRRLNLRRISTSGGKIGNSE